MAYDIQKVLDIAFAEEGYLEKASKHSLDSKTANAGSNNYTKYARDLDAMKFFNGRKQGFAWCAVFNCWCFVKAYGVTVAKKLLYLPSKAANNCAAGCKSARNYYKAKGKLYDSPKVGDQIFFRDADGNTCHTGIVYKVDSKRVYTIEGNTSSTAGVVANGGMVRRKSYSLTYKYIDGYGRPDYGEQPTAMPDAGAKPEIVQPTYTVHTVVRGDTLWDISKKYLGKGNRYPEIKTLNNLKSNVIYAGQKLKIPQ